MNSADDVLDVSKLHFEGDFNAQVENLLYHVRLTASEVQNLRYLFLDLENTLQMLAPGIKVLPFGSIVTGLGIKTSDVDCYVALPDGMIPSKHIVVHARNILRRQFTKFTNLFAITNAQVPIVKFLHIPTSCNCDVNFKSPAGVQNSKLICHLLQMDRTDQALRLAVLVKYWSKVHKMTGTNLLASYALSLMVIFYLQLMNMLPSIADMQKNVPLYMVDGWNMAFDRNIKINNHNNESFYELVGGFFKCYSNLKFEENIISPFMGRLLQRKTFKDLSNVPREYVYYKKNVTANNCKPLRIDTPVCVQDPFEHGRNASFTVHPKLAVRLKYHFQSASKMFDELPPDQFLRAILRTDANAMAMNVKKKPQPLLHNKIMKYKHKNIQQHHSAQSNGNLRRCYEQIRLAKKTGTKYV